MLFFADLPPTSSRDLHQAYCEIGLARVALSRHEQQSARDHLNAAQHSLSKVDNLVVKLRYLQTKADLDRLSGDRSLEEQDLTGISALANQGFHTLTEERDRWKWSLEIDQPYRRLLEIRMARSESALDSLALWESYRSLQIRGSRMDSQSYPGSRDLRHELRSHFSSMHDSTLLVFAVFPGSVRTWVADDRGIRQFVAGASPTVLQEEVSQFYRLCSDPDTPVQKLDSAASNLYQTLFAPVESALDTSRVLSVEADGFLTFLPWAALRKPGGTYVGLSSALTVDTGPLLRGRPRKPASHLKRVLIATPGAVDFENHKFLSSPDIEEGAFYITRLYPKARWLRGEAVTGRTIFQGLAEAEIFHFGGHAITRNGGGELILNGQSNGSALSASALRNLHMKLAPLIVLTACSTAAADRDLVRDPNGLVEAFLQSGASHVVASRWDVDAHSSAELVKRFYASLHSGETVAVAMRSARRQLFSEAGLVHPYYWASFELFGQGEN